MAEIDGIQLKNEHIGTRVLYWPTREYGVIDSISQGHLVTVKYENGQRAQTHMRGLHFANAKETAKPECSD